jgi:hypothetical protein
LTLSQQVRVPSDLYIGLRRIKHSLDPTHYSASPSVQDMVTVALRRFLKDWENLDNQEEILGELLEQRRIARTKMGEKKDTDVQ